MYTYFSTFITGVNKIVDASIRQLIKDIKIDLLVDGLIIYRTKYPKEKIRKIRFLNNSFVLLRKYQNLTSQPVKYMIQQIIKDHKIEAEIAPNIMHVGISFRVIAKQDNLISLDNNLLKQLENKISRVKQLRVNRSNPDVEYWFLVRREGFGVFGMRFTRHTDYAKILAKGELRPELASIMCLISEPNPQDVFLDPFTGSGAIPIERTRIAPCVQVIASDNDKTIIEQLKNKVKRLNIKIAINRWDALHVTHVKDASVDKIVTDPPWGLHLGTDLNLSVFYSDMLKEFHRVLKSDGILVLLLANKELFEEILESKKDKFNLLSKYNTLVSGQKAAIYYMKKG